MKRRTQQRVSEHLNNSYKDSRIAKHSLLVISGLSLSLSTLQATRTDWKNENLMSIVASPIFSFSGDENLEDELSPSGMLMCGFLPPSLDETMEDSDFIHSANNEISQILLDPLPSHSFFTQEDPLEEEGLDVEVESEQLNSSTYVFHHSSATNEFQNPTPQSMITMQEVVFSTYQQAPYVSSSNYIASVPLDPVLKYDDISLQSPIPTPVSSFMIRDIIFAGSHQVPVFKAYTPLDGAFYLAPPIRNRAFFFTNRNGEAQKKIERRLRTHGPEEVQGLGYRKFSEKVGVGAESVRQYCIIHNILYKQCSHKKWGQTRKELQNLKEKYGKAKMRTTTTQDIQKKIGGDRKTIDKHREKLGIKYNKS